MLCLAMAGAAAVTVPADRFTLSWTHSIEHTAWRESWRVAADGLHVEEARIKGSGAGMEPPAGARRVDGWYVYRPALERVPVLVLAASAFGGDHELCAADRCRPLNDWLGRTADDPRPVTLAPCSMAKEQQGDDQIDRSEADR
jgi:hypothetical protein